MASIMMHPAYETPDTFEFAEDAGPHITTGSSSGDEPQADAVSETNGNPDAVGDGRPFRTVVMTLNNPTLDHANILDALVANTTASWLTCGFEVGSSGTPHLQVTITNCSPQRWTWWRNFLEQQGLGACWFHRAIAPAAARTYCKKGGFFFEHKNPPGLGQGHRSDLDDMVSFVRECVAGRRSFGTAFLAPAATDPEPSALFRYSAHFSRTMNLCLVPEPRSHWTHGVWIHGPPGSGKTSWVLQAWPQAEFITWTASGFMNGYSGQAKVVVMDDEDVSALNPSLVKKLVNRTKVTINVKNNGKLWWNPEIFIILSNWEITDMEWYNNDAPATDAQGFTAVQSRFESHRAGYMNSFNNYTVPHDCPDWLIGQGPASGEQINEN